MTTAMVRCTQPGCDGMIEDGYCNTCGLAAPAASSGPSGPSGSTGSGPARRGHVREFVGPVGEHALPGAGPRQQPVGPGPTRRGPGRHPAGAVPGSGRCRARRPAGAGGQALLQQLRSARGPGTGRASRPGRRILPELRHPVLVQPQAGPRRTGRRPVRGARLPRPRRARLDLPGQGPQRQRPVGRAERPAEHRRRRRHGGRRRRAAVPGRGRAPQHRPDLQLRPARGPAHRRDGRLHRDGVRGRQVAASRSCSTRARQAAPCRSRMLSPTPSRCCPPSATCTTAAWSTATSSRTTSSRPKSSSSSSTWAASAGSTATRRSTGQSATRRRRSRPTARHPAPTCTPWAGRWPC